MTSGEIPDHWLRGLSGRLGSVRLALATREGIVFSEELSERVDPLVELPPFV